MTVPRVSRADVERIVRREFPSDYGAALEILDLYDPDSKYAPGRSRVQLAAVHLSRGDLDKLLQYIDLANTDYRDVLANAEEPGYFRADRWALSADEKAQLQKADASEYQAWLDRS